MRLDTASERGGVTAELVGETRRRLDKAGHRHVRIVVSGGIDARRIRYFLEAGAPVDAFGVGSAVSAAPAVDFTMDLKEVDGRPVAKLGREAGDYGEPEIEASFPIAARKGRLQSGWAFSTG